MAASVKTRGRLTYVEPSSLMVAALAWTAVIGARHHPPEIPPMRRSAPVENGVLGRADGQIKKYR